MAINIQEILHPSDSDAIKFEKINYNFDQIVANGGGPTGQKGGQGAQGTKGNTGFKGQKGEQGLQGETGATTSPWQVINVNPNSNTEKYSVLKPKITTDNYHPTIFLGDQSFNENTPADGLTALRATLTIGKHATGSLGSDELLRLWHGADNNGNNVSIDISSDNQSDNSVRYTFGKSFDLDSSVVAELYTAFDKFTIADSTAFKVPSNNTGTAAAGLIRYNPSTNVFQGGVVDGGNIVWTDFCMAPCGTGGGTSYSINIEPDGDVFVNQYGTPYTGGTANSIEFNPTDSYNLDNTGQDWTGATTTTSTTAAPTTGAPTPNSYQLTFPNGDNSASVAQAGGTVSIDYLAQVNNSGDFTLTAQPTSSQSWVTVDAYFDTVDLLISANNTYSTRSATVTLVHPQDSGTTATITVSQAALAATTQAPTPTTPAPTTPAPLPTFTSSNINLNVANGTEGQAISYTWSNNGTLVSVNPSTYAEGSATYTAVVTVPSGYSNAGSQVSDTDTATGTEVYQIRYNGGTSSASGSTSPSSGTHPRTVGSNSYTVSGFTFAGWYTAARGGGTAYSVGDQPPTSAFSGTSGQYDVLDLYADWTENVTTAAPTTQAPVTYYYALACDCGVNPAEAPDYVLRWTSQIVGTDRYVTNNSGMEMRILSIENGPTFEYSITSHSACIPWTFSGLPNRNAPLNEGDTASTSTATGSENPATGQEGDTYWNTTNNVLMIYKDGSWQSILDVRAANGL